MQIIKARQKMPARDKDSHTKALEYDVLMQRRKRLAATASALNLAASVEKALRIDDREEAG